MKGNLIEILQHCFSVSEQTARDAVLAGDVRWNGHLVRDCLVPRVLTGNDVLRMGNRVWGQL